MCTRLLCLSVYLSVSVFGESENEFDKLWFLHTTKRTKFGIIATLTNDDAHPFSLCIEARRTTEYEQRQNPNTMKKLQQLTRNKPHWAFVVFVPLFWQWHWGFVSVHQKYLGVSSLAVCVQWNITSSWCIKTKILWRKIHLIQGIFVQWNITSSWWI